MDKKDRRLLTILDMNSRLSINKIAKELQLSNNSVKNRIDKLTSLNIIKRFTTIINIGKLGFLPIRIFIKLTHASFTDEKELIAYLISTKRVGWIVSVQGHWDINTYVTCQNISEVHELYTELMTKFGHNIQETDLSLYREIVNYTRPYFIDDVPKQKRIVTTAKKTDDTYTQQDFQLLSLLADNSRISILELAQKTNLTTKTIIQKIKLFEKREIITGYRVQLNLENIGYEYYKIHIKLATGKRDISQIKKLQQMLSHSPEVIIEDFMTGGFDLEVEIEIKSGNAIRDFVSNIRNQFSDIIAEVEVLKYYEQHYECFFPKVKTNNHLNTKSD